jgi:hypothetical protein
MVTRKIIVYQKCATKPVVITDSSDQPKEKIIEQILEIFKSDKISILETSNDMLIIRPSEIQSVLITKQIHDIEEDDTKKTKTDYDKTLSLEGKK